MKSDEIARRIAQAPEPFRVELEDMRRRGIIRPDGTLDPEVKQALNNAARRVIGEQRAAFAIQRHGKLLAVLSQRGCSESSLKADHKKP